MRNNCISIDPAIGNYYILKTIFIHRTATDRPKKRLTKIFCIQNIRPLYGPGPGRKERTLFILIKHLTTQILLMETSSISLLIQEEAPSRLFDTVDDLPQAVIRDLANTEHTLRIELPRQQPLDRGPTREVSQL